MSEDINEYLGFEMEHLDEAVRNSYDVIINKKDVTDYDGTLQSFIHMPSSAPCMEVLDDMEEYFSGIEEYEKCAKIMDYKEKFKVGVIH